MEFQEVVRRRRMVRRFAAEAVSPEQVDRMLRNAVRAPSAGFTQGWSFLVLDDAAGVETYWRATSTGEPDAWLRGMQTAPVLIVVLASKQAYLDRYAEPDKGWEDRSEGRWPVPYWHVDAGMAALLILQTATDEGLGACFFGIPGERWGAVREAFSIPQHWMPTGAIAVGHAADGGSTGSPGRRARKPSSEVVHRGPFTPPG